jgi:hypothetical protein
MSIRETLERMMVAVTFAEAGEHETAREIMREQDRTRPRQRPSLRGRRRPQLQAPSVNRQG